jgi:hypothetical protein
MYLKNDISYIFEDEKSHNCSLVLCSLIRAAVTFILKSHKIIFELPHFEQSYFEQSFFKKITSDIRTVDIRTVDIRTVDPIS